MQITNIDRSNSYLIVKGRKESNTIDTEFLNALWQYVLYSKSVSRELPICEICNMCEDFRFEGFGGIKKVGNGIMYILMNDEEIYVVPDIIFHYFYIHDIVPTESFRDAVVKGPNPRDKQYIDKVKGFYCLGNWRENAKIKCKHCGKPYIGTTIYRRGKKRNKVMVYHEKYGCRMFKRDKYFRMCYNCLGIIKS